MVKQSPLLRITWFGYTATGRKVCTCTVSESELRKSERERATGKFYPPNPAVVVVSRPFVFAKKKCDSLLSSLYEMVTVIHYIFF